MKIKRKLYPNSNEKEFITLSISDLVSFGLTSYFAIKDKKEGVDASDAMLEMINEDLRQLGLKTPVSHQKRDKKVKSEENVNS